MEQDYEAIVKLIQSSPEVSRFITALSNDKRIELLSAARSAAGGSKEGMTELMSMMMDSPGGMSLASIVMEAFGKKNG